MTDTSAHTMKNAAILARVSTDKQEIESQIKDCKKYAKEFGFHVKYVFQEQITGRDSTEKGERESLQKLKNAIEQNGDIDAVFMWELSRLTRDPYKLIDYLKWFNDHCMPIYFIKECRWTRDPISNEENEMVTQFIFTVASYGKLEWETLRARTQRGKRDKAAQGLYVGSVADGYTYTIIGKDKHFVIDEPRADVIRMIFRMCGEEHKSTKKIARELNMQKIPTTMEYRAELKEDDTNSPQRSNDIAKGKYVQRTWSTARVSKILRNEWYIGKRRYKEFECSIEPIVTKELFEKAQMQLQKHRMTLRREKTHTYPLSELVRCGECGATMYGHYLNHIPYYSCLTQKSGGDCDNRSISKINLESIVWDLLLVLLNEEEYLKQLNAGIAQHEKYGGEEEDSEQYIQERKTDIALLQTNFTKYIREAFGVTKAQRDKLQKSILEQKNRLEKLEREAKRLAKEIVTFMRRKIDETDAEIVEEMDTLISENRKELAATKKDINSITTRISKDEDRLQHSDKIDKMAAKKIKSVSKVHDLQSASEIMHYFIKSVIIYQLERNYRLVEIEMWSGKKYMRVYNGTAYKGKYLLLSPNAIQSYFYFDTSKRTFTMRFEEYWEAMKRKHFSKKATEFDAAFGNGHISLIAPFLSKLGFMKIIKPIEMLDDSEKAVAYREKKKQKARERSQLKTAHKQEQRKQALEGLISINEAAKELGVFDRPIRTLVRYNAINLHKVGRGFYISIDDLNLLRDMIGGNDPTHYLRCLCCKVARNARHGKKITIYDC